MTDVRRSHDNDYQFSAEPKVVKHKRKYRGPQNQGSQRKYRYQNLMFEKRVVRGNTYSSYMVAQTELTDSAAVQARPYRARRQNQNEEDDQAELEYQQQQIMSGGPRPPPGCKFEEAYTDDGVETETDLPPCHDATTQTEWVIEKKLPDLSMPVYTGIHKETQIYANEGLFDFDYESEPIVQVIVTRVLEESQIEVVEEEELMVLKKRQRHLKKLHDRSEEEKRAIEYKEQEKESNNMNRNQKLRKKKAMMIDTHKHMISRVYSKRFLGDVKDTAFEILENMCMFLDEGEKNIKDEFMPWLYTETLANIVKNSETQVKVDSMISNTDNGFLAAHRHSVFTEMERRRLEAEEAQRVLDEKNDRRARKLAYKLKRRDDRRLYKIHNYIMDKFVDKGEDDNLSVNISEFDGSDAGINKTVGFRGGIIGELFLFFQRMRKEEIFNEIDFNDGDFIEELWEGMFNGGFIQDGWTVMVGLRVEFEKNYQNVIDPEFDFSQFSLSKIRTIESEEEYERVVDFIIEHYISTYFASLYPGMRREQDKVIEKYKPEEEPEEEEGDEDEGQVAEGSEAEEFDQDKDEEDELNDGAAKEDQPGEEEGVGQEGEGEGEEEQQEEDTGPKEWDEFKEFSRRILLKILDRNSNIRGINLKFNLAEEFIPEEIEEGGEEEEKDEDVEEEERDENEDELPLDNAKTYGLCLMIPQPVREENEEATIQEGSEMKSDNADNYDDRDSLGSDEEPQPKVEDHSNDPDYQKGGRFEFRKQGEVYLKPYEPEEEFFDQEFGDEILQIEHILPDVRIQTIYYPLLTKFRNYLYENFHRVLRFDFNEEESYDAMQKINKEVVDEVRTYANERSEIDLIYVNPQ